MASTLSTTTINAILPKLIEEGRNLSVAQSRFFQEMDKVKKLNKVNPTGVFTPFQTSENNTAFGVAEGGPILTGAAPDYVLGVVNLRQHWSSMNWTGALERIADQVLTQFRAYPTYEGRSLAHMSNNQLMRLAQNEAVRQLVDSTLRMYARRENYFALQGTDKSAIGVLTANVATTSLQFSWDTTLQGNRMFSKDQQIQIFSPGGVQRVAGLATVGSSKYNTVLSVDDSAASGATGPVTLAEAGPTDGVTGDTVVFRNSYGLMPQGFIYWVDDAGTYKGITRSTNPKIFSSVINRLTGTPTISPAHIRETLSLLESKMGYGVPFAVQIWMNKTQYFNWESQVYQSPFVRNIGPGKVDKVDLAVGEMYWDGHKFMTDPDVPPGHVDLVNFLTWRKIVQTPTQPYQFDSGSYVVNPLNSYGERLDSRQSTIFSEYNWDCEDPRANARIEGLAFNRIHV
jgi:hypothetical protein